jgi:hypothetical protein
MYIKTFLTVNITIFTSFAVDFQWLNDKVLVSCSKDGKIIQQLFPDAQRPVERAVSLWYIGALFLMYRIFTLYTLISS